MFELADHIRIHTDNMIHGITAYLPVTYSCLILAERRIQHFKADSSTETIQGIIHQLLGYNKDIDNVLGIISDLQNNLAWLKSSDDCVRVITLIALQCSLLDLKDQFEKKLQITEELQPVDNVSVGMRL